MSVGEAAREFETMFLVELLKEARRAGEPLAEESEMTGAESYQEFAERFLAQDLARRNAFGFARLIERELQGGEQAAAQRAGGPVKTRGDLSR